MEKNPKTGKRLTPDELKYIRDNCMTRTDMQISRDIGRKLSTIVAARRKLGIYKIEGGKFKDIPPVEDKTKENRIDKALGDNQRKDFFKVTLTNTLYYENLKAQFTQNELDFYLEEWASLCIQFEDILATEKRQIDEYIKQEIMGNRMLRNIKTVEEEIEKMMNEIEAFRKTHKMETDEEAQERDIQLNNLVRTMNAQCNAMGVDYQKNVQLKNEILGELNGRRKDRIEQISKRGTTFLGLIQEFRNRESREIHGKHMELMRLAKEKKKKEWRKPVLFADGSKDSFLVDELYNEKELIEEAAVTLESDIIKKYMGATNAKILVIDDDIKRCQLFSLLFEGNDITFASNTTKALGYITCGKHYDLICFDYDLGMNTKGDLLAKYIAGKGIFPSADILIHSMNKDGAYKIFDELMKDTRQRKIEMHNFESVLIMYKKERERNAQDSSGITTS